MDSVWRVEDTRMMSITALSQTAVEEKLKWRQDDNDGESAAPTTTAKNSSPTSMAAAAAMLSRNSARHNQNVTSLGKNAPPNSQSQNEPPSSQQQQAIAAVFGSPTVVSVAAKGKGPPVLPNYHVVLEKSPPRICNDDSDTSTYDNSFHCRETDICQDSTDYDSSSGGDDSFTTEGIATVDIVEYEVASASDDDADSVNNSSSGTDDHGIVMAAVTTALDTTTSSSDFADSEESDSDKLFDRELTEADYWECIQCKNSHNNPLYRMCEKCYKIRRTHFPPRPRFLRKRLNRRQRLTGSLTEIAMEKIRNEESMPSSHGLDDTSKRLCTSMIGKESFNANYPRGFNSFKKRKLNPNNKSQLNSAAETSDEELSDIEHRSKNFDGHRKRKSPLNRNRRDNLGTNVSSSGQSSLNINKILDSSLCRKRKLSTVDTDINPAKQTRTVDLKNISNMDTASDTDNDTMLNNCSKTQKDSGVSSAHSSQEAPSSSLSDERSVEKDEYIQQSIEGTTISEPLNKRISSGPKSNTDDEKTTSTLISEINNPSDLIRSASDCSSTLLNNLSNLGGESFSMNNLNSNLSSYGSCIICLSGPKNGVFVHSRSLHLCSCYKCAVKIWSKYKRCPVCNSSVKNVLKLFVH